VRLRFIERAEINVLKDYVSVWVHKELLLNVVVSWDCVCEGKEIISMLGLHAVQLFKGKIILGGISFYYYSR